MDSFILLLLREIIGAGLPDDVKVEVQEIAKLSNEIQSLADEPKHIPLDLVARYNELVRKHFPEGDHAADKAGQTEASSD